MKITHLASTACLLSVLAACNNDTPTGSLTVPFQIGLNGVCSYKDPAGVDVPVANVRIGLYRPGTIGTEEPVLEDTVACSEGAVEFPTVNAGTYEIVAEGLDSADLVVFDNEGADSKAEVVEGQAGTAQEIRLLLTPVKLYLRWTFGFGNSQCDQIPLKVLAVEALRDSGASSLGIGDFACDQEAVIEGNYRLFIDENRDLNGNDLDSVVITPQDAAGKSVGQEATFQFAPPGPGRSVKLSITIECTDTACDLMGSGTPD